MFWKSGTATSEQIWSGSNDKTLEISPEFFISYKAHKTHTKSNNNTLLDEPLEGVGRTCLKFAYLVAWLAPRLQRRSVR